MARTTSSRIHLQRLFREGAEGIAALLHDLARHRHLLLELRIVGRQPKAVGTFNKVDAVSFLEAELRRYFFRQHETGGVADFAQFDRSHWGTPDVITIVIT